MTETGASGVIPRMQRNGGSAIVNPPIGRIVGGNAAVAALQTAYLKTRFAR